MSDNWLEFVPFGPDDVIFTPGPDSQSFSRLTARTANGLYTAEVAADKASHSDLRTAALEKINRKAAAHFDALKERARPRSAYRVPTAADGSAVALTLTREVMGSFGVVGDALPDDLFKALAFAVGARLVASVDDYSDYVFRLYVNFAVQRFVDELGEPFALAEKSGVMAISYAGMLLEGTRVRIIAPDLSAWSTMGGDWTGLPARPNLLVSSDFTDSPFSVGWYDVLPNAFQIKEKVVNIVELNAVPATDSSTAPVGVEMSISWIQNLIDEQTRRPYLRYVLTGYDAKERPHYFHAAETEITRYVKFAPGVTVVTTRPLNGSSNTLYPCDAQIAAVKQGERGEIQEREKGDYILVQFYNGVVGRVNKHFIDRATPAPVVIAPDNRFGLMDGQTIGLSSIDASAPEPDAES